MASVNISEEDFMQVALAAKAAQEAGDGGAAAALDKIARKMNAALTAAGTSKITKSFGMPYRPISWDEMPSTLD